MLHYTYVQAKIFCTSRRAKAVVIAETFGAVAAQAFKRIVGYFHGGDFPVIINYFYNIAFGVVVPLTVLVINVIVVREVRRASNNAAVNLGLQQHQQSTSSNSAVPTAMLIATSLLYILLLAPSSFIVPSLQAIPGTVWCSKIWRKTLYVLNEFACVSPGLFYLVYAYNFFVYVIIGKQFRRELRRLCSCCSAAAAAADNGTAVTLPHAQPTNL